MTRAKRRTKEEREAILRTVKRSKDGTAKAGSVKHAARTAGVSPNTIYGWISRDGWPDAETPGPPSGAEAPAPLASGLQVLASGQEAPTVAGIPLRVSTPPPTTKGQMVAALYVNQGLTFRAIAEAAGVSDTTVRRWLMNPGPVRDYVNELREVQRRATAEHVAEVAYFGARASAGAARIASEMVDDARDASSDEALPKEELERMEIVDKLRVNAIGATKAMAPTFLQAWKALDVGALNLTRTETTNDKPTETRAERARALAAKLRPS